MTDHDAVVAPCASKGSGPIQERRLQRTRGRPRCGRDPAIGVDSSPASEVESARIP